MFSVLTEPDARDGQCRLRRWPRDIVGRIGTPGASRARAGYSVAGLSHLPSPNETYALLLVESRTVLSGIS
jgi:hypothetical protein